MCITHSHDFSFEKFTEPSEFMSHPSSSITGARNSIDFARAKMQEICTKGESILKEKENGRK